MASREATTKAGRTEPDRRDGRTDYLLMASLMAPIVLAMVGVVAMMMSSMPHKERIEVADMRWERTVAISEIVPTRHEGWEFPEGARLISAEKRAYQYVRKMYQYRGTPIYADWYVYETDDLTQTGTASESGGRDDEMKWPEPKLGDGQSVGQREQRLTVTTPDGTEHEVSQEIWDSLRVGDSVDATVTADGKIVFAEGIQSGDAVGQKSERAPASDQREEEARRADEELYLLQQNEAANLAATSGA